MLEIPSGRAARGAKVGAREPLNLSLSLSVAARWSPVEQARRMDHSHSVGAPAQPPDGSNHRLWLTHFLPGPLSVLAHFLRQLSSWVFADPEQS